MPTSALHTADLQTPNAYLAHLNAALMNRIEIIADDVATDDGATSTVFSVWTDGAGPMGGEHVDTWAQFEPAAEDRRAGFACLASTRTPCNIYVPLGGDFAAAAAGEIARLTGAAA